MKKLIAIAGLALVNAGAYSVADAQSIHSYPAQAVAPEVQTAAHAGMQRAPLNAERAKGTKIFGASTSNGNRKPVYFNIYTNDCNQIVPLANVKSEADEADDPYNIVTLSAAAAAGNDTYYAFKVRKYSVGYPYPVSFEKVDPRTGQHTVLADLSGWQNRWTPIYSLAYNPKDGKLWGLTYGSHEGDQGGVASTMVGINTQTGLLTGESIDLPSYYFSLAFNYDGTMYGVSWLSDGVNVTGNRLDEFDLMDDAADIVTSKELKVEDRAFKGYYEHGLGFDYSTGDLYWFATNSEGNQYLIRVNPDNATTEKLGPTGFANMAIGPHIVYRTGEARNAPAMVSNPAFTASSTGDLSVTLSWTNPTKTWNRRALTDLAQVYVYRDAMQGEPAAKLDATAGQQMSWQDTGATNGVHTYYIVGVNTAGKKGVPEVIEAFVGKDVPGPVANLSATTTDGKTVDLSWEVPARGDNDGWYDKGSLKYTIIRQPDNKVVAQDLTARSFTDNTLSLAQTYTYEVIASNSEGAGSKAVSAGVLAGASMSIPFTMDFKDAVNAGRFTVIDRNGDNNRFGWDVNNNDSPNYAMKLLLSDYDNDDLLVTPALYVKNGKSYKVEYTVSFGRMTGYSNENHYHHFAITAGDAATAEAQTMQQDIPDYLVSNMYQRSKITGFFTAPHDGDYYVGLNVLTTNEKMQWVYVEDIKIIELSDDDLQAVSIHGPNLISTKDASDYTVKVFNAGKNAVSDYTVKVMASDAEGNDYVLAQTAQVPTIEAKATAEITLSGCNDAVPAGAGVVYGQVEMAGDANTDNDMSPAVAANFVDARVSLITDASSRELNTAIPVYFAEPYSATQTVYTSEVTGFDGMGNITVHGIGIPYSSNRTFDGTKLQVYMGSTVDRFGYGEKEYVWCADNQTKCFEGEVSFKAGDGLMYIEFDTPFVYDGNENLVVSFNCLGHKISNDWPVKFAIYDNKWDLSLYHCMRYRGASAFDPEAPATQYLYSYPYANEIFVAADYEGNSVGSVVAKTALSYDSAAGVLSAAAKMQTVSVYSLQGQLVKRLSPNADSTALKLAPGIYLVTVKTDSGATQMLKIAVK